MKRTLWIIALLSSLGAATALASVPESVSLESGQTSHGNEERPVSEQGELQWDAADFARLCQTMDDETLSRHLQPAEPATEQQPTLAINPPLAPSDADSRPEDTTRFYQHLCDLLTEEQMALFEQHAQQGER